MRKKYCCDASRHLYESYYMDQSGSGMPVFVGSPGQRGHGLGSMLSGFFRSAFPMIKRGLAAFGKHALKTGLDIANDVVAGDSFQDSTKRRVPEGIKRFATAENFINQSGSGGRRIRRKRKRSSSTITRNKKKSKKHKHNDIFA